MDATLLEKELFEVVRADAEDGGRDDEAEEEKAGSRGAPAIDVARPYALTGLELGGAGAGLAVSPARSARVFRFKLFPGGSIAVERALVAEADISKSLPGVGM